MRLAMLMTSRTFTTGEVAVKGYLYVVMRGIVLLGGRVLTAGMWWGDDVLRYMNCARRFLLSHSGRTSCNRPWRPSLPWLPLL